MAKDRTAEGAAGKINEPGIVSQTSGSLFTIALTCPSCGGALSFAEGSTKVVCAHCGRSYRVVGRTGQPRYWIPARISRADAGALVGGLLEKIRDGRPLHFVDSRLVYIPFFRVKVTGGGWYIGKGVGTDYLWQQYGNNESVVIPREVTRNVAEGFFRNISFLVPAVDISELGLIGIWAKSSALQLLPMDPDKVPTGEVCTLLKESHAASQEAWATLVASAKPAGLPLEYFEAEKVNEEISLIYYPIWIVRFFLAGAPRRVVVDGLGGDILSARVGKGERTAAAPGIVTLAVIALLATTMPILLIFPGMVALYYIISNGRGWFWGTLVRLFLFPWRSEENVG
jgi:predicted RNA-binding Zn-ribbon protein involved in translation (DUF1610 family)